MSSTKFFFSTVALTAFSVAAHAGFIYGLSTGNTSGILKINTATGASTSVFSLSNLGGLNNRDDNGLAVDNATNTFYYKNHKGDVYRRNSSGETKIAKAAKGLASATFYNGYYFYVEQNGKTLRKIDVTTGVESVVGVLGGFKNASYGDIASDGSAKFYGASSEGLYSSSLTSPTTPVSVLNASLNELQLGFYGADLNAIATDTDRIYSVNKTTGALTQTATLANGSKIFITDAASAPVPEPATMAVLGLGAAALLRRRLKA